MTQNTPHLDLIIARGGAGVEAALVEAIGCADAGSQSAIAARLLERAKPGGLAGLVTHYHSFNDELRKQLCREALKLGRGLHEAARLGSVQARMNVIQIIRDGGVTSHSYLLAQQLHGNDSQLARAAAEVLFELARRFAAGPTYRGGEERRHVESAVAEACACFHQHRRRGVVMAAMCFARRPGALLVRHLIDRRGAAHQAAAELLARGEQVVCIRALLPLAGYPEMHEAVTRGLSSPTSGQHLGLLVRDAHLLLHEPVQAALRHVRRTGHLRPSRAASLDSRAQLLSARWTAALSLEMQDRIDEWSTQASHESASVRLLALGAMTRMDRQEVDEIVATMCFDSEAIIARMALRHLMRRGWSGLDRLMIRLIGSAHESVRRLAEQRFGRVGFERWWSSWSGLSGAMRLAAGRALMKIEPQFLKKLSGKLSDADAQQRLQAIMVARQLDQVSYFEGQLVRLCEDRDNKVASAAIRAVGGLHDSVMAVEAIERALEHEDDRVRANAIEAMDQMHRLNTVSQKLERIARGRGNRSRATAIKALLELPLSQALPQLQRMLHDEQESHRTSALWVVEKLGLLAMLGDVADLARHDADQRIRQRALRMVREMASGGPGRKRVG